MKISQMLGMGLSVLGLAAAPVAQAATRPSMANISVASGTRLGQTAVGSVRRASSNVDESSNLLGIPLLFIALGAGAITIIAVVVATNNNSNTPGS